MLNENITPEFKEKCYKLTNEFNILAKSEYDYNVWVNVLCTSLAYFINKNKVGSNSHEIVFNYILTQVEKHKEMEEEITRSFSV